MRFGENRLLAWIVLALAVLLSVSLSGGKAMKNMRAEAERIFMDGASKDGLRSINNDLDKRAREAQMLLSIAKVYLPTEGTSVQGVQSAVTALDAATEIPDKYVANRSLSDAVEELYTALERQSLSETDKTNILRAYKNIQSGADTISRDTYNTEARRFNDSISKFPAAMIADFTGVEPLELFE